MSEMIRALEVWQRTLQRFTAVPHTRLWGGVFPHSYVVLCVFCVQEIQVRRRSPFWSKNQLQRTRRERVRAAKPPPDGAANSFEFKNHTPLPYAWQAEIVFRQGASTETSPPGLGKASGIISIPLAVKRYSFLVWESQRDKFEFAGCEAG